MPIACGRIVKGTFRAREHKVARQIGPRSGPGRVAVQASPDGPGEVAHRARRPWPKWARLDSCMIGLLGLQLIKISLNFCFSLGLAGESPITPSQKRDASKQSRVTSSRADVTFDDTSAGRAEDAAAISYTTSVPLKGQASHFFILGIYRPRKICLGARYLVLTIVVCVCPPDLDRSTRRQQSSITPSR